MSYEVITSPRILRADRKCHGDDSTEAGWMLAVRAELKAGQRIVLQRLMEAKCARPFVTAGNTEVVRQEGSSPAAAHAQPMSAVKGGADRNPEEKTNNVEVADALGLEAAKRKLDFEERAEDVEARKFKGVPAAERDAENPSAECDDVCETPEDEAVEAGSCAYEDQEEEELGHSIRDCCVKLEKIDKMLPAGLMERIKRRMREKCRAERDVKFQDILALHPGVGECSVLLKDLKNHPWYGSKISGMTPCESAAPPLLDATEIKQEVLADSDEEMMTSLGLWNAEPPAQVDGLTDSEEDECSQPHSRTNGDGHDDSAEEAIPEGNLQRKLLKREDEHEKVLDLTRMKQCVENGEYTRVLAFHLAFKQVLATVHVPGPGKYLARNAIKKVYKSAMAMAFPWFDVSNPAANYEANTVEENMVRPPNEDHTYAEGELTTRAKEQLDGQSEICEQVPRWKKYKKRRRATLAEDKRKCLFCHQQGDADKSRLIYFRQNGSFAHLTFIRPFSRDLSSDAGWVHVNCALWSSEVYEEVDGSLQNVGQALSRGSRLLCTFCRSKGASVGCCHDNCKSNYHFTCGVKDGAAFKLNKGLYCRLVLAHLFICSQVSLDSEGANTRDNLPMLLCNCNICR